MLHFGQAIKTLAEKKEVDFVDFNAPLIDVLSKAGRLDPGLARAIIPDRIHPSAAGHWIMAASLLKAWNAPSLVSAVEINADGQSVSVANNTEVTELERKGNMLSWSQLDQCLPAPMSLDDKVLELTRKASDVIELLNRETLRMTYLTESSYILKIDGEIIGKFSKEQLSNGINLATMMTPMMRQSYQVHELTNKHIELQFTRWRQIQMPFEKSLTLRALKVLTKMDKLENDVVQQQWETAQPKLRKYELIVAPTATANQRSGNSARDRIE